MISKNTKHTNWTTLNTVIFIFKNRQYFLSFVHSRHLTGCRSIQFQRETHTMLSQTLTQNLQQTVKYASTFWLMFGKFLIVFDSLWQGCKKAKQSKYEVEHILISFLFLLWRLLVYWFKRLISPITLAWRWLKNLSGWHCCPNPITLMQGFEEKELKNAAPIAEICQTPRFANFRLARRRDGALTKHYTFQVQWFLDY